MSVDGMHVAGFKPADDKWQQMKAVWDACDAADIAQPDRVMRFFNYNEPDMNGVLIEEDALRKAGVITDWSEGMREGVEINVAKLPKDYTVIRVYMSY